MVITVNVNVTVVVLKVQLASLDFIGFGKMKKIIKIIVVFRIKFTHILTNSHKVRIKY